MKAPGVQIQIQTTNAGGSSGRTLLSAPHAGVCGQCDCGAASDSLHFFFNHQCVYSVFLSVAVGEVAVVSMQTSFAREGGTRLKLKISDTEKKRKLFLMSVSYLCL